MWDTAGQERFRSVTRSYYRGAGVCLIVFDITRRASFEPLAQWLADARALASPDLVVVIVGNKLDREHERQIGYVEASRWAQENGERARESDPRILGRATDIHLLGDFVGASYIETSSVNGQNVEQPFALACESILSSIAAGRIDPEKAGSGISYGDRGLRSVAAASRAGGPGSSFSFAEMLPNGVNRGGGGVSLQHVKQRFGGCC